MGIRYALVWYNAKSINHAIGWWSTGLLILFRLFQGIAAGGELVGAYIYTIESVEKMKQHRIEYEEHMLSMSITSSNSMSNKSINTTDTNDLLHPYFSSGFWGSSCEATGVVGLSIGIGVAAILRYCFSREFVLYVGWRIPFWFGILLGTGICTVHVSVMH